MAALLVAYISGRGADQSGDVEFLHVLAHIQLNERLGITEQLLCQSLGQQGFAHTGRAEQGESADGTPRIFQVRAGPTEGLAKGRHRLALANNDLGHLALDCEQTLHLPLFHALERDARPLRNDVENIFFIHLHPLFLARRAPFLKHSLQPFLGMFFLVAHGGGAFKILVLNGALFLGLDVLDVGLEPFDFGRAGHRADARARAGFIHQVNRFVRQVSIGDIAVGQFHRSLDSHVGELGLVVVLVLGPQPL